MTDESKSKSIGTSMPSSRQEREEAQRPRGCVVWFTGLSACGKSTVANLVDHKLHAVGVHSFVLDGDNIRHGLNAGPAMLKDKHGEEFAKRFGLGFSAQDREENIRRIGAVAKLFARPGSSPSRRSSALTASTATAFGPPWQGRLRRDLCRCPHGGLRKARPQGAYTRRPGPASSRALPESTTPTRPPQAPELILDAAAKPADALADQVIAYLRQAGKLGG